MPLISCAPRWSWPSTNGWTRILPPSSSRTSRTCPRPLVTPAGRAGASGSRVHEHSTYVYRHDGMELSVRYQPAESDSGLFGGNSNWRGPIWFPVNFLIIESLQKFHHYYGDDFRIECPTGSGNLATLNEVASEIASRLTRLFLANGDGRRPVHGLNERTHADPNFRDYVLFYEYFHGDTGRGVGAAHQTGWTGLVAKLLMPRYAAEVRPCKAEQAAENAPEHLKVAATSKSGRPRDVRPAP